MDAINRIIKTINHEEPDCVPSFELEIDNYDICHHYEEEYVYQGIAKSVKDTYDLMKGDTIELSKTLLRATETRGFLKNTVKRQFGVYAKIGIDAFAVPLTGYVFMPTSFDQTSFSDEYGRNFDLKQNPDDGMDLFYYRDGNFKSFEDYDAAPKPDPDNPRREKYFKAIKKGELEYEGKVYAAPALWSLFEATWQAFGFTNFSKLLIRSSEIKKVFDERGKFLVEVLKRYIEWGESNLIFLFDDFGYKTGLLISPGHYKKYVIPWVNNLCKVAHKAGLKVILHSCGDISKLFTELMNAGIDGFHPIEPTTTNPDYNIFKLKEKHGDKITLIGNVSPQDLATESPEFIRNYTKKLIKELAPGGGYILSSGHSINPEVTLENFLTMHDTLKKYGKYPIKVD